MPKDKDRVNKWRERILDGNIPKDLQLSQEDKKRIIEERVQKGKESADSLSSKENTLKDANNIVDNENAINNKDEQKDLGQNYPENNFGLMMEVMDLDDSMDIDEQLNNFNTTSWEDRINDKGDKSPGKS